ncbi:MAG: hypothetical protein QNJ30_10060, partial [Kiloniellales bacterium]|nr:hypothetical protein [Kiloniellales bacterium]
IRACGSPPRQQAGHMTASKDRRQNAKQTLARRGPSTHDPGIHRAVGRPSSAMDHRVKPGDDIGVFGRGGVKGLIQIHLFSINWI